jgi:peptidoglycan hydrolase-like protein with peptidoglycan-binding domain
MGRVIFKRAATGYRAVRGEVVRRIQSSLRNTDCDPGDIDGIFGNDTETALRKFNNRHGLSDAGVLTLETWSQLMQEPLPEVFDRCLQLTADFEGQGFEKPAGNFDGAGLTWGIIGFTLQHGEIQEIIHAVGASNPESIQRAFGTLESELSSVLGRSRQEQLSWADGISIGSNKERVQPAWDAAFTALGNFPEVRRIQIERARQKYWARATSDAARFGMQTEMGLALCFDVAVQNGGIDSAVEGPRISAWIGQHPGAPERDLRVVIADAVAENSRPKYVEDVRVRKRTIATGDGRVHGSLYATADWGLDESASASG